MKAVTHTFQKEGIKVDALNIEGHVFLSSPANNITPRGVSITCNQEQVSQLHSVDNGIQVKYQTILLCLELSFKNGEVVQLETSAQVQSICRKSQREFEVFLAFSDMVQDGYRHISRYIVDSSDTSTS